MTVSWFPPSATMLAGVSRLRLPSRGLPLLLLDPSSELAVILVLVPWETFYGILEGESLVIYNE